MSTSYTTYDPSTGKICKTGITSDIEHEILHTASHLKVIKEFSDANVNFVVNHKIVKFPPKPSEFHVFNYSSKVWEPNIEMAWEVIKKRRSFLLAETDWVVVKAQETGTAVPEAWLNYRQALRDVTLQSNPLALVWPRSP